MRRARWKKKTLWAAAFQTSFEMPFPALFTGVWTDGSRRLCLLCLPLTRTNVRVPPGCTAVLFCCRTLVFSETPAPFFRYPPDCDSKRGAGGIRNHPFHRSPATADVRQQKRSRRASGTTPSTNLPQLPRCGSKREAGSIRERPQLLKEPYVVEWAKPSAIAGPKPP